MKIRFLEKREYGPPGEKRIFEAGEVYELEGDFALRWLRRKVAEVCEGDEEGEKLKDEIPETSKKEEEKSPPTTTPPAPATMTVATTRGPRTVQTAEALKPEDKKE